ncbi:MAG: hypothetical protein ACSHXF_04750 [Aquaticitalea sp.]
MSYKIDWIRNDVIVTFKGTVSLEELREADGKIYGNSKFDDLKYGIYDFTDTDVLEMTYEDIKFNAAVGKSASIWKPYVKLALVSQDDDITNLIMTFINLMKDYSWDLNYFSELDGALSWVGAK